MKTPITDMVAEMLRLGLPHNTILLAIRSVETASAQTIKKLENGVAKSVVHSFQDTAGILNVHPRTLRRMLNRGAAPKVTNISDRRIGFTTGAIEEFLKKRSGALLDTAFDDLEKS